MKSSTLNGGVAVVGVMKNPGGYSSNMGPPYPGGAMNNQGGFSGHVFVSAMEEGDENENGFNRRTLLRNQESFATLTPVFSP